VGITSACAVVEHYGAVIIGVIAGLLMIAGSKLLRRLRIDDPLDSITVHFFCGIWCASPMRQHSYSCL
jgi:Amt family ammonium transporter